VYVDIGINRGLFSPADALNGKNNTLSRIGAMLAGFENRVNNGRQSADKVEDKVKDKEL
jgi:hypothetical protein